MKRILFFLILMGYLSEISAQAYIDNRLNDQLLFSSATDFIPVNIYLKQQLDVDSLHQEFRLRDIPLDERTKTVIFELQQLAGQTQKELISVIEKEEGRGAINLQSFWIMNMLSIEASPDLIYQLSERNDIGIIELNTYRFKILDPVESSYQSIKSTTGAEPGLIAINAHKLWAMGYTGKNRIGMNVDTGVNFRHPSIKRNYLGNYMPISQCWFPFNNPVPLDISDHSHGTHTIGTMMGLNPVTSDTIGVAFDALWISSDPIVSDLYYLRTLPEIMSSFEWALNPDGDTSTVNDIPDVINNSWGWVDPPDTFQCNSPYTAIMDVVEAAGIAAVFSAGNDGDLGAGSVGEPGHKAKSLVNAFAVGSVNANTPSLLISDFSSRGPTVCADSGSLQIKPEVVAPGQDVRSAMGQDDYGTLSGTSMASPHVAGAILLLKEAFPYLSGEEIKLALYFTASDLGPAGEDNIYGNGLIDVFAAFNYLSQTYVPVSPVSPDLDLVFDEFILPNETFSCNSQIISEIRFSNRGLDTITDIQIRLIVDKTELLVTNWTGNLFPNQSQTYSFAPLDLLPGYHVLQVELSIDGNPAEFNSYNNFGTHTIRIVETFTLPFIETFDTADRLFINTSWSLENHDSLLTWKVDTCSGLINSIKSVYMDHFYYKPELGQTNDLISPLISLPDTGGLQLMYDIAYRQRRSWTNDSIKIYASTDCGVSFPFLLYANGGDSLETFPHNMGSSRFYPQKEEHWRNDTIDISQFVGSGSIMLKFTSVNDRGNSLWLDNIEVNATPGLVSAKEIQKSGFEIFPVPASDLLQIRFREIPSHKAGCVFTINREN